MAATHFQDICYELINSSYTTIWLSLSKISNGVLRKNYGTSGYLASSALLKNVTLLDTSFWRCVIENYRHVLCARIYRAGCRNRGRLQGTAWVS